MYYSYYSSRVCIVSIVLLSSSTTIMHRVCVRCIHHTLVIIIIQLYIYAYNTRLAHVTTSSYVTDELVRIRNVNS